jgi:EmrB/QacA subfamily drug resistance transporter
VDSSPRADETSDEPLGGPTVKLRSARGVLLLTTTVIASSMAFLDATVVNLALPAIGTDLKAGTGGLTWVVTGYALPLASLILLGGALGDRYGQRLVFGVGVALFTAGTLGCAVAPTIEALHAGRGAQGVGAALLTPTSLALLQSSIRPGEQGRAVGIWSGLTGVSSAAGPLLAAGLIESSSWRAIFLINLPLAAVVLAMVPLLPRTHPHSPSGTGTKRPFDVPGAALLTIGLSAITAGLTNWAQAPVTDPLVVGLLFTGITTLALFVMRQTSAVDPLLPREAWASRTFVWINVVTFLVYAVLSAAFLWVVVTLQVVAGQTPLAAGLALLPVTILMLTFSPAAGAASDRYGTRGPISVGIVVTAVALGLLTRVGPDTDYLWEVLVPTSVLGVGLTAMVTPLTAGALASLPLDLAGTASGVNNAAARTGGLLGVAALPVVTGLGQHGFDDASALDHAFGTAMWLCVTVLAVAAILTIKFIPSKTTTHSASGQVRWHCSICQPPQPPPAGELTTAGRVAGED